MVFYKNGKWHLCNERVRYLQHGEEITQYVGSEGHDWWIDFEKRWEHTEIIEFISVEPTEEQLERLEDVQQLNLPDGFGGELSDYVEFGIFPEGFNHVLKTLQIQKDNIELSSYALDVDMRLTIKELGL